MLMYVENYQRKKEKSTKVNRFVNTSTMADDIDIEEHDLLDNPRIKNIFPDITSIKTEVIDYEEDTTDYQEEMNYGENFDFSNHYNTEPMEYENDLPDLYQNKIILGSKPCSESPSPSEYDSVPTIRECSIVLQDFGPILDNSPYCSSCQTLFPTENALDSHKMTTHSFLVAVSNNKAIKSTSKSSISAIKFASTAPKGVVCNHCNEIFPDEIALIKHSYELLPEKFEDDTEVLLTNDEKSDFSTATYISCEICSCLFKLKGHYLGHMKKFHGVDHDTLPNYAVTNFQCRFCPVVVTNSKRYNGHIYYTHKKLYTKKIKKYNSDQFKCDPCNITFPTAYSEKIHVALNHPNIPKSKVNTVSLGMKETKIKLPGAFRPNYQRPFAKSTLFSCDKCQIHFVSCLVAVEHSKRCVLTKGDWKCKKCRRSFKMTDRDAHLKQHEVSDRLKVIKIREGILDRIICRCLSCQVCFDERNMLKYHSFGCSTDNNYVYCSVCQIRIHEHAVKKHNRIHNELGPDVYFVIIDFIFNDESTNKKPKAIPEESAVSKRKEKAFFYFHCPSCKLCMKINRLSDHHRTGKCNKSLAKCLCKMCGLRFSVKGYKSHKEAHKRVPNLKLCDMFFRNTQTDEKIDPPFPTFKKCKKCKVCFFSSVALRSHICHEEEVKICDYCGEKLSDLAYKLHVPFHEYRNQEKLENELIKKYESLKTIWNILYLCVTCDTVLDSYDDVVEHSQDHFCNMENYNVTINHCDICDLNFMGKSYERHENLHLAGNISKSAFEIIKYNYETLLSDKWLDIFTKLVPEQVDQILKKSIYKDTRSVRMTVFDQKNSGFSLYQCGVCNVMVENNKIIHHIQDRNNCLKITNFSCNLCQFKFDSKTALKSHQILHENLQIGTRAFKIISFNNEKDVYVNDSLKSVMNPEALKFIRCQHCGKLINKVKYNKHMHNHRYSDKKKHEKKKIQPKFVVRPKFKNAGISSHTFYKCKLCGVCVFKQNIKIHFCSKKNQKKQCNKCLLWFRASNIQKHYMYHEKYKFTKGVNVVSFKKGVIESDRAQGKMVVYQCKDCKICLHWKHNIPRHKCVSSGYFKECSLCEVSFHCSHFYIHQQLHDTKSFSKKNLTIAKFTPMSKIKNVTKPLVPVKFKNNEATWFLKKKSFKTKIVPKANNMRNLTDGGKSVNYELTSKTYFKRLAGRFFKCGICKLLFLTGSALVKHTKCCDEDRDSSKCDCGLVFHSSALQLHKKWQRCGQSGRTKYFIVTLISENIVDFDLIKCLYTCRQCGIYYLSLDTVLKHIEDNHLTVRSLVKCEQCDLPFTTISNTKHNRIHHKTHNWSLSDLNVFEVKFLTVAQVMNDFPEDSICDESFASTANDSSLERKSVKRKLVEKPAVVNKVSKIEPRTEVEDNETTLQNRLCIPLGTCDLTNIYKCDICDLSFLHKKTLATHYSVGRHKEYRITCKCGLKFTLKSLKRHLKVPTGLRLNEIEKLTTSIRKDELNESQNSEVTVETDNTLKLFKCSECDVYFLTHEVCQDHISNHQVLDPTEYIACKICELQFLCEYLGAHMRTHRDQTFNIEKLMVTEFQPDKQTLDTYRAVDRLKSKAVSTTTHFDTEDEKSESLDSSNTAR
ncbi:unnamed protein product, partial [Brenthis ino]